MRLEAKRLVIAALGTLFLLSLVFVQWMEVARKQEEAGASRPHIAVPAASKQCVDCLAQANPGIIAHWKNSTPAEKGGGCVERHAAETVDADGFEHYGKHIATVVTPRDCSRCHVTEAAQFAASHHAKAGNILASLDNFLAETVEGARMNFNPHSPTPGRAVDSVNGFASAFSGCQQCHGSKVAFQSTDGGLINVDDLRPDENGKPTNLDAVGKIVRDDRGRPLLHAGTWPNTGIGRLNDVRASPRTAASATSARTIRRRRSTKNRSTAWPIAT